MSGRIDDFFKKKLSAHDSHEFQEQYWKEAEAMLDGKKPNRKVWMWLLPLLLVGVVGTSIVIFGGSEELTSQLDEVKTNMSATAVNSGENSKELNTGSENLIAESTVYNNNATANQNNTTSNNAPKVNDNLQAKTAESKVYNIESTSITEAKRAGKDLGAKKVKSVKVKKSKINPTVVLASNVNQGLFKNKKETKVNNKERTNNRIGSDKKSESITNRTNDVELTAAADDLAFLPFITNNNLSNTIKLNLPYQDLKSEQSELIEEDKNLIADIAAAPLKLPRVKSALVIDIYGGVGYKYSSLNSITSKGVGIVDYRNENETNKLSSIVGVNLRYMLSSRFSVGSGLQFDEIREKVDYNLVSYTLEDYYHWKHFQREEFTIVANTSQGGGGVKSDYDTIWTIVEDSIWTYDAVSHTNNNDYNGTNVMRFVDIPFMIGVHGKLGKNWGYDLLAGGSLGYLVSSKGYLPNSELTNTEILNDNNLSFRRPIVSSFIQPGIHYSIGEHVNLNFSPRFKANLTPLFNHNNNYSQKMFGGDLTIGMSYKF